MKQAQGLKQKAASNHHLKAAALGFFKPANTKRSSCVELPLAYTSQGPESLHESLHLNSESINCDDGKLQSFQLQKDSSEFLIS